MSAAAALDLLQIHSILIDSITRVDSFIFGSHGLTPSYGIRVRLVFLSGQSKSSNKPLSGKDELPFCRHLIPLFIHSVGQLVGLHGGRQPHPFVNSDKYVAATVTSTRG